MEFRYYAKNRTINVAKNQVKIDFKRQNIKRKWLVVKGRVEMPWFAGLSKKKRNSQTWKKYS